MNNSTQMNDGVEQQRPNAEIDGSAAPDQPMAAWPAGTESPEATEEGDNARR